MSTANLVNAVRIRTRIDSETLHLPELRALIGQEVEIIVLSGLPVPRAEPVGSIDQLRSKLPDDPFGPEFEGTIRRWRQEPWVSRPDEGE